MPLLLRAAGLLAMTCVTRRRSGTRCGRGDEQVELRCGLVQPFRVHHALPGVAMGEATGVAAGQVAGKVTGWLTQLMAGAYCVTPGGAAPDQIVDVHVSA